MASLSYSSPDTYQQWATDLLQTLGDPTTASNITAVSAWEQAEEPIDSFLQGFNPLNTEQAHGQATTGTKPGAPAVPEFANLQAGLTATADTINQSNFELIAGALKGGQGSGTLATALKAAPQVGESAWGTDANTVAQIISEGPYSGQQSGAAGAANAESDFLPGNPNATSLAGLVTLPSWLTSGVEDFFLNFGFVILGLVMLIVGFVIASHAGGGGDGGQKSSAPKKGAELAEVAA
jgi:hypothetical protein